MTAIAEPIAGNKQRTRPAFLAALGVYFFLQILIRVWQGGAAEMDEAEQVFYAQHLRPGYENQPPLYTWLQALAFQLAGVNHFALAVTKNLLMFALYASVYQSARLLIGRTGAAAVSASLAMIVTLGWEAQIDRTHSILATAVAAASLWCYLALLRAPGPRLRVLLGLLFGLGMLSKYNFLLFVLGLTGASLLVPEHRRIIWTRDVWMTPLVGLLIMLPHAVWFAGQADTATTDTLRKMHEGGSPMAYGANVMLGLRHFGLSILSFITPLWVLLACAWTARKRGSPRLASADARFFFWLYACGLGAIAALVLGGELVHVQSRWLQPLLFSFPLAFFVFFPPVSAAVYRRMLATMAAFAALLVTALAFRPQLQAALGRDPRILQPFPELAAAIRQRFPGVEAFAVQDRFVGGNMRLQFPQVPVVLMRDACALSGELLLLSGDGMDDVARTPMPACANMRVIGKGKIGARSGGRPGEQLEFDYLWISIAPGPETKKPARMASAFEKLWSEYKDSNLGPSGPKPDALPGCATLRRGRA
ncbi:hypothetical protein GCM10027321_39740 [Massilia terrae]